MNTRVPAQTRSVAKSTPPVRSNLVLQHRANHGERLPAVPSVVHDALNASGQPLDNATRAFMEPRFGHDFGNVRVHTDSNAAESARAAQAQAYTVGNNVVFGANKFAPATQHGRELLAHELAHTIQQRSTGGPPPSQDPSGIFESSANAAGRDIANGANVSGNLPSCGIGVARSPVPPSAFDDQQLDDEIKRATERLKPGEDPGWWITALQAEKNSRASRVENTKKEREQRAAAERERKARAAAVADVAAAEARWKQEAEEDKKADEGEPQYTSMALEAPGRKGGRVVRQRVKKPPKPAPPPWEYGDALIKQTNDALKKANEELDARIDGECKIAKRSYYDRFYEARRGLRDTHEEARLLTAEQVWDYGIKHDLFLESELKAVFEDQNASQDDLKKEQDRIRMKFEYEQQLRRDQFYQNLQLAPIQATLLGGAGGFAQVANFGTRAIAAGNVIEGAYTTYAVADTAVQMHRAVTTGTPSDVVGAALPLASGLVFSRVIGGGGPVETPSEGPTFPRGVDITQGGPFTTPDFVTPSRPTAGFGRDIEPAPQPVPVQDPYLVTQMPSARVVQGDQPTVGNLKAAFEFSGEGPPPTPGPSVKGFQPAKDVVEKPGLIESETGPREYVKREYLGDVNPGGEQQPRYFVNVQLDKRGMMDADFVLRGEGKRSGSLFGKNEFLEAKQHFEQRNGAGSVKGAYGRWGGGDNLDTFNTRYTVATQKGFSHDEALIQAARKTKTGEWARAAGFDNVKITKAEGSPGAYTNVEVEFTK